MPEQQSRRSSLELLVPGAFDSKTTDSIKDIPIQNISPNPYQPRTEFDDETINKLSESIKSKGLLQPIIVRPVPENGTYEIVAGERRLKACKLLDRKTISAIVREYKDEDIKILALVENLQREDLSITDKANGIQKLLKDLKTTQSVATALGLDVRSVQRYLRIAEMPEPFQDLAQKKEMNFRTTDKMASLASKIMKEPEERQEKITAKVKEVFSDRTANPEIMEEMEKKFFGPKDASTPKTYKAPAQLRRGEGFQQLPSKYLLRLEFKKDDEPTKEDLEYFKRQGEKFLEAVKAKSKNKRYS